MTGEEDKDREDRIRTLELAVEEQRRDYDVLNGLYDHAKLKNFTFLAAALALLGYLYTGTDDGSLKDKLFIPDEPYGVILYAFGLFFLLSSVSILMLALVKTRTWSTAHENGREDVLANGYEEYLKYIHQRYDKISVTNSKSYEGKRVMLNMSFTPLVLGGTILLLLKTFGG